MLKTIALPNMINHPRIQRFEDMEILSRHAAGVIAAMARSQVESGGRFTWVLSGGSSPIRLYQMMAEEPFRSSMPWDQVYLFWGDERCVPPSHSDNNYGMAFRNMISRVPIPDQNIFRMPSEVGSPAAAADRYEATLRAFFRIEESGFPEFDLLLLGVGKDGHTASLFPSHDALCESRRWVTSVSRSPVAPNVPRLTLTLPVINSARHVLFVTSASGKEEVIVSVVREPQTASPYPVSLIQPKGDMTWLIDDHEGKEGGGSHN